MKDPYKDWTKYHIVSSKRQWRFYREGMKRSIMTNPDRNTVIKEGLYRVAQEAQEGGLLTVHYKDGTVDFIVDNWVG